MLCKVAQSAINSPIWSHCHQCIISLNGERDLNIRPYGPTRFLLWPTLKLYRLVTICCIIVQVWPHVRIKSSPISPQTCPKSSLRSFYFKIAQKIAKYLGYFCNKIWHQELSKSPNLVTLKTSNCLQCSNTNVIGIEGLNAEWMQQNLNESLQRKYGFKYSSRKADFT